MLSTYELYLCISTVIYNKNKYYCFNINIWHTKNTIFSHDLEALQL